MSPRKQAVVMWLGRQCLLACRILIGGTFIPASMALLSTVLPATTILGSPAAAKAMAVTACACIVGSTLCSAAVEPLKAMLKRRE